MHHQEGMGAEPVINRQLVKYQKGDHFHGMREWTEELYELGCYHAEPVWAEGPNGLLPCSNQSAPVI